MSFIIIRNKIFFTSLKNKTNITAGKKLSDRSKWLELGNSERAYWGQIKGSGTKPYFTQIDIQDLAYKCSCPSRQFPCKHGLGLLLVYASVSEAAPTEEPEWVSTWIEKRKNKSTNKAATVPSQEQKNKSATAKVKRQEDRQILVSAGVAELSLWLDDLIRVGLLELPNKPKSYFDTMAARMVDAKAPGLAGWIKALSNVDFSKVDLWFDDVVAIVGKLNLLLRAWRNIDNLPLLWQQTIRQLVGWSQSPKELQEDKTATAIKDDWLVLGQQKETNEEIVTLRTWLWGCHTGSSCLHLAFGTRFSPLENTFAVSSVQECEVAFFPSILEQRGIVRKTKEVLASMRSAPIMLQNLLELRQVEISNLSVNPWINNQVYLVANLRLVTMNESFIIVDIKGHQESVTKSAPIEMALSWILATGDAAVGVAVVRKTDGLLPLGVFIDEKYLAL